MGLPLAMVFGGACIQSPGLMGDDTTDNLMTNTMEADMEDPNLWLEAIDDEAALDWVRERNAVSTAPVEADPAFEALKARLLKIYNSSEKIPYVSEIDGFLYNFWQDAEHVRGVMRRTTLESYRTKNPEWEVVLDMDALADSEEENWVYKGWTVLHPDENRALVRLSRGGGDAVVIREFDLKQKAFVAEGFEIPEAKSRASWKDRDTLLVGTDFGEGTLTTSGYPRTTREWKRGTSLADAPVVFEGAEEDVSSGAYAYWHKGERIVTASRGLTFFTNEEFLWHDGAWVKLDKPDDADAGIHGPWTVITLRTDWKTEGRTWPGGALLVIDTEAFLRGDRDFEMLYEPAERSSLQGYSETLSGFIVNESVNVRDRFYWWQHGPDGWQRSKLDTPEFGSVSLSPVDGDNSDDVWMTVADFLTPTSLYRSNIIEWNAELLKQLPSYFDIEGLSITQNEAVSKDGTRIPYFMVYREGMPLDGSNPTLVYGYGGFEVSMNPYYSATTGVSWLEKGGVYVLTNIRGGGEFGPDWHNAAIKENRQLAYDDFIAVGEDLIARRVTSSEHMACLGGSNGGLLTGNMLVQRPDLWGAVVSAVPLLDMKRFNHLLAGASWMGEYGNPDDPEQWAWLQRYSPYHQVNADVEYPPVLFTTSPAMHARWWPVCCSKTTTMFITMRTSKVVTEARPI